MQLRRAVIIASYLSTCLCFITYDTGATRGSKSTSEPGIGTHQQGQDKVVAATTGASGLGESDRHSAAMATRLSTLSMALLAPPQGDLTNGATHTGVIQVGGTDTWTIQATANDRVTVSVGEVSGNGFSPRLRLQDPNGVSLGDSAGTNADEIGVRVTATGTYTVLVSNNFPDSQSGNASYMLTIAKTPGPYTISSGDEGGPLTNGASHTGVISIGDLDPWTIQATANDRVTVSVGEVSGSGFSPRLRLQDPNGVSLGDSAGTNADEIGVRVTATGTYTVLVSNNFPDSQVGPGNYMLTVAKTPGPYTISSGDEGGPLTNGATHTGVISIGDLDPWTIQATANDRVTVSVGEVSGSGFSPRLRLQDPNGVSLGDSAGTNADEISVQVTATGTYTVLVSNNFPDSQSGNASYMLTVAKTPGPYTISSGDEGGPLTNGTTHTGVISIGDLDPWTIQATANDRVTVSVGEVSGSGFSPRLRLQDPNGVSLGDSAGTNADEIGVRVTATGTYTVLVSNNFPDSQSGNASYMLTIAKTPGPYTISSGDEGGPLTNGATHTGVISIGDLDPWTIQATANDRVTVSVGEVSGNGFSPRLRLQDPSGATLGDSAGTNADEIGVRVTATGTYTVLVSNNFPDSQVGPGNYMLTVAKTPGPYTISSGDEGGPLTNGATHTGVISIGDLDPWTIQATANDRVTVSVGEVSGSGFSPRLRLQDPNGVSLGDSAGTNADEISVQVTATGTFTVLVSNNFPDSQSGNASYMLTVAKTPGPYTISSGDEGGPLINGVQSGVIGVGDLDAWSFQATQNSNITLSLAEVSGNNFSPQLRLLGPNGALLGNNSGTNSAQIGVSVPLTGMYTVLVSNDFPDSQVGPASYTFTFSGPPQPTLSINNVTQNEGNSGTTSFTFNVTLSGQTFQTVTVNYATANGTATAPSDYTAIPSTPLPFNPGDPLTKTVTVLVNGDTSVEPNEAFFVILSGALGITVSNAQGTGTINNDDNAGTIQFSSATYNINENGSIATITATRLAGSSGGVSAEYATSNGTATAVQDYAVASGTLNWADGDTAAKTFNVPITEDSVFEGNETVNLALSNPTGGATLGTPNTAVLTILDNETQATTPLVLTEEGTNRAVALDSVNLLRGPFRILTDFNFSGDRHTRVILFTSDLGLSQPDPTKLTVRAGATSLVVENVGTVTGVSGLVGSYIIVRLADGLPTGDLPLVVTLNGAASSNSPTLTISP